VSESRSFRLTGTAEELDGFIRSIDDSDELEITSISYRDRATSDRGVSTSPSGEQISVYLSFGHDLSPGATYELVMGQYSNFQRTGLDLHIEQVQDADRDGHT
jgi:hypothetical protein